MSLSELLLGERQTLIKARLAAHGRVIATDLAQELGVSEDTIRRDLREMAAAGLCRRVYGGALPTGPSTSFSERVGTDGDRKDALARAAAALVEPGAFVFLDAGSTNLAIARALPEDRRLTVATNTPAIAAALIDRRGIEIIQIGGPIDRKTGAAIGAKALRDAEVLRPDLCILGICGLHPDVGVTAFGFEDAEFKRFVAMRSRAVLTAVTNDKLAMAAPYAVIPIGRLDRAVFEADADEQEVAECTAAGLRVIRADPVEPRPNRRSKGNDTARRQARTTEI
ncbi:DeoR/GlpR family DNA-binding transcription regulator [Rhizobium sp. GN54]|uniref:DeoR/GlpR family DNA-binding transcription regulator n=1 Tax=Rhizobium sp. GN54 TaxID=2898150 RepID=UPI001E570211|nr:DeoR/GlpR family DNA-binding transcription regulator [Rhizobium sp. GN54]MCD2182467.1 DeoR/GlpR family DNA-binding transcription regulator [Rhizobium sp. GN54]